MDHFIQFYLSYPQPFGCLTFFLPSQLSHATGHHVTSDWLTDCLSYLLGLSFIAVMTSYDSHFMIFSRDNGLYLLLLHFRAVAQRHSRVQGKGDYTNEFVYRLCCLQQQLDMVILHNPLHPLVDLPSILLDQHQTSHWHSLDAYRGMFSWSSVPHPWAKVIGDPPSSDIG
jgi:hypothetical protein